MRREMLRLDHITQMADGVKTLDNFTLQVFEGEIMGLLSADTQGRKDLLRLVCSNLPLHYGRVYFNERLVNSYQHSDGGPNSTMIIDRANRLVDALSVSDNIFVLRRGFKKYLVPQETLHRQLVQFARALRVDIRGDALVRDLTVFQKCVVQLMKAMVTGTRLVVVQDISNIIPAAELAHFQDMLRYCAGTGMTFLYICNHHEESFTVCDRVALMRGGQVKRIQDRDRFDDDLFMNQGLDFSRIEPPPRVVEAGGAALRFENVQYGELAGLDLAVRPGEVVSLLDVDNRIFPDLQALLELEARPQRGHIRLDGEPYGKQQKGRLAFLYEAPHRSMVYGEMTYLQNLCFLRANKEPRFWRSKALQKSVVNEYGPLVGPVIQEMDVTRLPARELFSLVYYRVHLYNPRVAVCLQPFLGADMYLRHHILYLIDQLRKKGIAVLLLSVNISDTLTVADRMLVVEEGRLVSEFTSADFPGIDKTQPPPHRQL